MPHWYPFAPLPSPAVEATTCFMVAETMDAFTGAGDPHEPLNFRVGAMWWRSHDRGGDLVRLDTDPRPMPHLAVMTPAGIACLDCPATGDPTLPGRYWLRQGDPPAITVTPSLDIKGAHPWHGWITAGVMKDA